MDSDYNIKRVTLGGPRIIGGICEYCGVIDKRKKSGEQYKLCKHFKENGKSK